MGCLPQNQWLDHPNLGPIIPNGNGKPQNETQEVKSYYWTVDYYTNSGLLLYYSRIIDIYNDHFSIILL